MNNLERELRRRDGVAHISTLRAAGIAADAPRRAVADGAIIRVRPGVYCLPSADRDVVRAARVGGRVAAASATRLHGLWEPPRHPLFVEVGHSASHLRDPDFPDRALNPRREDVVILWAQERRLLPAAVGISPLLDTLRQVIVTESQAMAVAVIDTALRRTPIQRIDLEELALTLPPSLRGPIALADGRPESGTESILRVALAQKGVDARPQVRIPFTDLDRLDLLVGDRLVIECQSKEHHDDPKARDKDLRRFADLAALGFVVLQFGYEQVLFDLDATVATVLGYVDRGLHRADSRWPSRP